MLGCGEGWCAATVRAPNCLCSLPGAWGHSWAPSWVKTVKKFPRESRHFARKPKLSKSEIAAESQNEDFGGLFLIALRQRYRSESNKLGVLDNFWKRFIGGDIFRFGLKIPLRTKGCQSEDLAKARSARFCSVFGRLRRPSAR